MVKKRIGEYLESYADVREILNNLRNSSGDVTLMEARRVYNRANKIPETLRTTKTKRDLSLLEKFAFGDGTVPEVLCEHSLDYDVTGY